MMVRIFTTTTVVRIIMATIMVRIIMATIMVRIIMATIMVKTRVNTLSKVTGDISTQGTTRIDTTNLFGIAMTDTGSPATGTKSKNV